MSSVCESGTLQHMFQNPSLPENLNQTLYASNFTTTTPHKKNSETFSSLSPESPHMITDGLGIESSDSKNAHECWKSDEKEQDENFEKSLGLELEGCCCYDGLLRLSKVEYQLYPPPISCIGRNGKPRVSFVACKDNGRFVLTEIRIPVHELLHAVREDGRLKLQCWLYNEVEEEGDDDGYGEEEDYSEVESVDEGEEDIEK